jgi:hypothetical protein
VPDDPIVQSGFEIKRSGCDGAPLSVRRLMLMTRPSSPR